jgi:multidrug efflux system membrane fusion protein
MRTRPAAPLGALACFVALAACGNQELNLAPVHPPTPVTAATAVAKDVPLYLDAIGRALASESVVVTPQVSGRITAVEFQDGAELTANQPLFTIDPRPFLAREAEARARAASAAAGVTEAAAAQGAARARVAAARGRKDQASAGARSVLATLEAVKADSDATRAEAERMASEEARLVQAGAAAVSAMELERAQQAARSAASRHEAARRRVAAAEAAAAEAKAAEAAATGSLAEAEAQLAEADARATSAEAAEQEATAAVATAALDVEYASIKAPIAGRAGRRLVDAGNVVTANVTPLLSIQRTHPLHVEFTVPEEDLPTVQRAMKTGPLDALASLPESPDDRRKGSLAFVDNAVVEGMGSVRMRAVVPNEDGRFWPGRFARVRLVLDDLPQAVLVPAAAVQVGAVGPYVYVVGPVPPERAGAGIDGVAALRPVDLGQRHEDLVVVTRGIAAGERVVAKGGIMLFPGAGLRIPPPEAPAAPAAPPEKAKAP